MAGARTSSNLVRVELAVPGGPVVVRRQVRNTVFASGAGLLSELAFGRVATPINGMGVGTNAQPSSPPFEDVTLDVTDETGTPLEGPVAVPLEDDAVEITPEPEELRVRVAVRAVLPPQGARAADGQVVRIAEAALGVLSDDGLSLARAYNRVTFEPVPKEARHELALYWEVFFPYGH